jgi:hypothetical protein
MRNIVRHWPGGSFPGIRNTQLKMGFLNKKLFLVLAAIAFWHTAPAAQGDNDGTARPPVFDLKPPVASPDPSEVNPFLGSVNVTLTGPLGETQIYYDLNNPNAAFDTTDHDYTHLYTPGEVIAVSAATTLRAKAFGLLGLSESDVAVWIYNKDASPVVAISAPANGAIYHALDKVTFTSTVTDPDGPAPLSVSYYSVSADEASPTKLGDGTGSDYKLEYQVPSGTAPGAYTVRAIATDGRGASGNADVNITIANQAPVANAGPDSQILMPANSVQLNGTGSSDPDGNAASLKYEWSGAGVTFVNGTTATPTAQFANTGTYTITLKVTDQGTPALSSTDQVIVTVNAKPAVTSALTASGSMGSAFSYSMTATGYPAPTLAASGYPPWMSFNPGTGVLSGTPSTAGGPYSVILTASNTQGSETKTLTITINPPLAKPAITSPLNVSGNANTPISYTITATGYPAPTYSLGAGKPAWLSVNATTGALSGTPASTGTVTVAMTATNSQGADAKNLVISIDPALAKPAITSATTASGTAKVAFSYTLTATGYPTPSLSISNNPSWLNFNSGTGVLSGTPQNKGTFTVNLAATNNQGADNKTLTINVGDSAVGPAITSAGTATGKVGSAFTYTITATGTSPITYTTTQLPGGLSLSGQMITGSPTASGTYNVTVTAANPYGTNAKTVAITLNADPKITVDLDTGSTVNEKSKATLSVTATGYPSVTYQWQFSATSGGTYSNVGPNASTYTINPVNLASQGYYKVVVKNGAGPDATSRPYHLVVKPLPAPIRIILQPVDSVNATVGETVKIITSAIGAGPLLFQWYKGGSPLPGTAPKQNDSVLAFTAKLTDAGNYRVKITNPYTTSDPGTYAFSDSTKVIIQEPKLPKPKANPVGGAFYPSVSVKLSSEIGTDSIYYTTNGQDPTVSSKLYRANDVITFDTTGTLKAKSFKTGYRASDVMTEVYSYNPPGKVVKPASKPATATFKNTIDITLSTTTAQADIYYTTDGSSPLSAAAVRYTAPFPISSTVTIKAVARKNGMLDSDILTVTYTQEVNMSKVLPPTISPPGRPFNSQLLVTLKSPADSLAALWYTDDGTPPDTSSTRKKYDGNPITVSRSCTIKVVGIRNGYYNSDFVSETYQLVPGPITADPPTFLFDKSVTVKLSAAPAKAEIHYMLDGIPTQESPLFPAEGLTITATTTISAVAISEGVSSSVYTFGYTLNKGQLATPITSTPNNQTVFKDTLRVTLTPPIQDAVMYYTKDGSTPSETHGEKYTLPFLIDTTTSIQVIAVANGFESSKILVTTYTLVPDMPVVTPPGGPYLRIVHAKISCSSKKATLLYTLDGSDPTTGSGRLYVPGDSIPIDAKTTLKAVAVVGNRASDIREVDYDIFLVQDFVLKPGTTSPIAGGNYNLRIPEDEVAKVHARIDDPKPLNLAGFDGVQFLLKLELDSSEAFTGNEFPKVTLAGPASDNRSLYAVDASGRVFFLTSAHSITLTQAGTYFMGIDVAPPIIEYKGESFTTLDSTLVSFRIKDNVANLTYDLKRNDDPFMNANRKAIAGGADLAVKLKHPAGVLKPLSLQLIVSDYQQASFFPPETGTMLSVSQRLAQLNGPPLWGIGTPGSLYDLVGIPLALNPPLTMNDLQAANPGSVVEGAAWSDADNKYHSLDRNTALQPGKSYWLGSRTRIHSLILSSAATKPTGTGSFTVSLRTGWNQIANPHLQELYWPHTRNLQDAYRSSQIKGLWEYSPSGKRYLETESLAPWRGYYVYSYVPKDTVVTLLSAAVPVPAAAQKKSANDPRVSLDMGWGAGRSLHLGAAPSASDDLGIEDEFSLPRPNSGLSMSALRHGRSLTTDWTRFRQDGIQEWTVAMDGTGDSLPSLRILGQDLPQGYETWAVSKARGMKFRVEAGKEIPASGLARDTLTFYSGPMDRLAGFGPLQRLAATAAPLDLRVAARNGGFGMQVTLPSRARVRAVVWGLDGSRKGVLSLGPLSEGYYRFTWDADFGSRGKRLPPGMYVLSLDVRGTGLDARLTRKIALSD